MALFLGRSKIIYIAEKGTPLFDPFTSHPYHPFPLPLPDSANVVSFFMEIQIFIKKR